MYAWIWQPYIGQFILLFKLIILLHSERCTNILNSWAAEYFIILFHKAEILGITGQDFMTSKFMLIPDFICKLPHLYFVIYFILLI